MNIQIGQKHTGKALITNEMILGFANSTGDKNPVHLDQEYAERTFFKNRIAHGMLIGGLISAILGNEFPGNGTIYISQTLSFLAPVFINDMITVEVEVTGFTPKKWVELRTDCIKQDGTMVLRGNAVVIPPKDSVLLP